MLDEHEFDNKLNGKVVSEISSNMGKDAAMIQFMRNTPVSGDFNGDQKMWEVTELIAKNASLPMKIRLEAFAKMNELTGEDDPVDEVSLQQWIEDT